MIKAAKLLKLFVIHLVCIAVALLLVNMPGRTATTAPAPYQNFEAPQVHPLALTPDGTRLLALNTADNRLMIFQLKSGTPVLTAEIPVGLQPVSVAVLNDNEAWVANWLSDSISVVDLNTRNVKQTIDVGDEPTDIAFLNGNAFVCVSEPHEIKVFDLANLNNRPREIKLNGKKPRSLSIDAANARVFVSIFHSGNKSSIVPFKDVREAGGLPEPNPSMSPDLPPAPRTSLIVKEVKPGVWQDDTGDAKWSKYFSYTMADVDLVIIDAADERLKTTEITSIGTNIGNSILDPTSNRLFVINTDSHNEIRFEPNLKARFISTRISILDLSERKPVPKAVDLNPHINYDRPEGTDKERRLSIGLPLDIVRTQTGKFYISSLSTAKVAVLDRDGNINNRIDVGLGPTGLALDETRRQLYTLNRFENTISVIDLNREVETIRVALGYDPEPAAVRSGRLFLYSSAFSAHGDLSCASCHRDGHRDDLAWDLGDPRGKLITVETPDVKLPFFETVHVFHPMKGPMMTQSLKGIFGNEPLHWRGDRKNFEEFNDTFITLLGGSRRLLPEEMAQFKAFVMSLTYPPNPYENLDRTYPDPATGPSAARGQKVFSSGLTDQAILSCIDCHDTRQNGGFGPATSNLIAPNFLLVGTDVGTDVNLDQDVKIPQMRGIYEKFTTLDNGRAVSGFGYLNDGYRRRITDHLGNPRNFSFKSEQDIKDVEAYVISLDTGTPPAVGLQITINSRNKNSQAAIKRIKLLIAQADQQNCELIVKGVIAGEQRGFFYTGKNRFRADKASEPPISWQKLLSMAGDGSELTFTGVPVGEGYRQGIDQNNDMVLDGDGRAF